MSVFRNGLFASKTAIVTGGGTGIGRAIAKELLSLGANVVIASRKLDNLQKTKDELTKELNLKQDQCSVIVCNIREEDSVKQLFKYTLDKFGNVDFLVNNGGGQFPSPAEGISAKGWRTVIDLNLTGTFLCCKEAFHSGMNEKGGAIVNIICEMNSGFPGMSHTGAARDGVRNMTKSLAVEWANSQIRVNCVAPGVIFNDTAQAHYSSTGNPDLLQSAAEIIPARRLGTVEEISSAVLFLLSPGAQYISGISLDVGGGSHLIQSQGFLKATEPRPWPKYEGKL